MYLAYVMNLMMSHYKIKDDTCHVVFTTVYMYVFIIVIDFIILDVSKPELLEM